MYRENRKAFYFLLFDNNFWFKGEIHILIESIGKKKYVKGRIKFPGSHPKASRNVLYLSCYTCTEESFTFNS